MYIMYYNISLARESLARSRLEKRHFSTLKINAAYRVSHTFYSRRCFFSIVLDLNVNIIM